MMNRLLSVLFVPAIACGGGDTPPPTPVDTVTPNPDSPAALACPPAGPLMGSVGSANMRVGAPPGACGADGNTPCDWYTAPTMGANTGIVEFAFASGIQGTKDQLQFHVATPINVGNTPIPWETNGMSMASYTALSIYLQSQNGSNVDRVLFPTNGSITVTESNQAMGQNTTAVVNPTMYAELDDTGAVLSGGCTVALQGLNLFLVQGSATFQETPSSDDNGVNAGGRWVKMIPMSQLGTLVEAP